MTNDVAMLAAVSVLRGGRRWNPTSNPVCTKCGAGLAVAAAHIDRSLGTENAVYLTLRAPCKCGSKNYKIPIADAGSGAGAADGPSAG